ncbi:uncharacterized protein LOC128273840 [Anopheles cruzii]|uniref:uncharacterized protein LOC128273840 n=1 Tax=Anopheles cruzii TaxID=68878 RepID=UPI0022EC354E|nr:uncharacterized protein LOC128273840 [Anopheles cruzii]
MDLLQCFCKCVRNLTEEDLRRYIDTLDRAESFVKEEHLKQLFRCMCDPEAGTSSRRAKPRAIKYLNAAEEAIALREKPTLQNDEERLDRFLGGIDENLEEEFSNASTDERAAVLEKIAVHYSKLLAETSEYQQFKAKLADAYKGKIKISRNPKT